MSKGTFKRLIAKKHAELAYSLRRSRYNMYDCTSSTESVRNKYGRNATRIIL